MTCPVVDDSPWNWSIDRDGGRWATDVKQASQCQDERSRGFTRGRRLAVRGYVNQR
jgi:hypothetical protein